ncbi:MAG: hypothetical protein IJG16_08510 [Clostridia bacterium]|nr:hypothetical protein [Clostridia bacterium]
MKRKNILFSQSLNKAELNKQTSMLLNYTRGIQSDNCFLRCNLIGSDTDKLDLLLEEVKELSIDSIYITDKSVFCSRNYSFKQATSVLKKYGTRLVVISNARGKRMR